MAHRLTSKYAIQSFKNATKRLLSFFINKQFDLEKKKFKTICFYLKKQNQLIIKKKKQIKKILSNCSLFIVYISCCCCFFFRLTNDNVTRELEIFFFIFINRSNLIKDSFVFPLIKMNIATLPPAPNWCLDNILVCANDKTVAWGAKDTIVIANPSPDDENILTYRYITNAHKERVTSLSFSPEYGKNNKFLLSSGDDNVVKIWNLEDLSIAYCNSALDVRNLILFFFLIWTSFLKKNRKIIIIQ